MRQGHATLPFLKIDMGHWGHPSRAPMGDSNDCHLSTFEEKNYLLHITSSTCTHAKIVPSLTSRAERIHKP